MKKMNSVSLRKLLMTMAVISLLVMSLSGCSLFGGAEDPTEPPADQITQTDPTNAPTEVAPTDAPTEPEEEVPAVMGTVTDDNLNVRSNPSTDSTVLKRLDKNTRVLIIEQRTVGNVVWGRIADGWINLNYVLLDGAESAPTEPDQPDAPVDTNTVGTGFITASELNIRKGPGTNFDSAGKYYKNEKVTILEVKDGWGRTDKGWVSMKYVEMAKEEPSGTETPDIGQNTETEKVEIESDGKTKVLGYGIVDVGSLNVRTGPGTKYDNIAKVSQGNRYAYYQKSGSWVRIDQGWVSTGYFYIEGTEKDDAVTGTITTDLNIRTGPGKEFESVGSYKKGTTVKILHVINEWGCTDKGWVSMKYVETEGKTTESTTKTGTITGENVNIRKGPGKDYDTVGQYDKGDKIEILETKDGWARTDRGWVILDYVKIN